MKAILISTVLWLGNLHRRVLSLVFALIGPRLAYTVTRWGARFIYRQLDPLRERSEWQCRAALGASTPGEDIARMAEQSYVHRAWNLTDLMLASYRLRPGTFERYGGRIPEPYLGDLLAGQQRRQPTILVTAYYGSFDLMPIFLGYNGISATVVYRRHGNAGYDAWRTRIRSKSGCEMVALDNAAARLGQVLEGGGTVGIVADHHVEDRGMSATFMGLPAKAMRSVGLLAWRYEANVVVAALRRVQNSFRFEFVVEDVVDHKEIADQNDAVTFVTERYLRAMERIIMQDPSQYLWASARWGTEHARELKRGAAEAGPSASLGGVSDSKPQADG